MSDDLLTDLYNTIHKDVISDTKNEGKDPQVGFYAKFVKKLEQGIDPNEKNFEEALEFQKFAEGKRPVGCCIIWGCTKKTTRKCKCGCLQFVCKECSICMIQNK